MLDLYALDVDDIATALADHSDYEHRWLIDPRTGEIVFWTSDTGIDGENPIDLDELDLLPIDPPPSCVWYADMAHFAQQVSEAAARQRLSRALCGRGAFRRFKDELYGEYPTWCRCGRRSVTPARRRAVGWLLDQELVPESAARDFTAGHPDPVLP